jgi:hypothetical protein
VFYQVEEREKRKEKREEKHPSRPHCSWHLPIHRKDG